MAIGKNLGLSRDRFDQLRDEAIAAMMVPDARPVGPEVDCPAGTRSFCFNQELQRYAIRPHDDPGVIRVHRAADGKELTRVRLPASGQIWMLFSPDGHYLAVRTDAVISIWDVDRQTLAWSHPEAGNGDVVGFSRDSRHFAVAPARGKVLVHDLVAGSSVVSDLPTRVEDLKFSPDGRELAIVLSEGSPVCRILNTDTGRIVREFPISQCESLVWSHDGRTLAFGGQNNKVTLHDAITGERGRTLENPGDGGFTADFHPAGTLFAACGWPEVLRIWDPALGKEWLSVHAFSITEFSRDGRLWVLRDNKATAWQVDPALECVNLADHGGKHREAARTSIHKDGRILSLGTKQGVILWDLAHRTELAFLPIGLAWHTIFEPTGDLITNGDAGLLRWPVQMNPATGLTTFGPPRILQAMGSDSGISTDREGRIVACAKHNHVAVLVDDKTITIGPLEDCRGGDLSPDGRWLSTGNHGSRNGRLWSLPDAKKVADFPIDGGGFFSPDGKWLLTTPSDAPQRLWEVGTWRQVREFPGNFRAFSPDGRIIVLSDRSQLISLVDIASGRTLARIERPDTHGTNWFTYSADGTRLVMSCSDTNSVCIIDLRLIRRGLAKLGLDWDAPAFPEQDTAHPDPPPLVAKVDYGVLAEHLEYFSTDPRQLFDRYDLRLRQDSNDGSAYHHRAHAHLLLNRPAEAIQDLTHALELAPANPVHLLRIRADILSRAFHRQEDAIADLERALKLEPNHQAVRDALANYCNELAWELAAKRESSGTWERALELSKRAADLAPSQQEILNTRGVVLYRARAFTEAILVLERSLAAGAGQYDGYDLCFLAMAHHRLGHREQARQCLDRALAWLNKQTSLTSQNLDELREFRAEAEAVLAEPAGELPDNVFAEPVPAIPR